MRNLSISLVAIFFAGIICKSCQDDTEICGEGTTPRLNIKFFDQAKQTPAMRSGIFSSNISSNKRIDYVFSNQDSILLPLSYKSRRDTLIYRLTEDAEQEDTIFFNYEPKEIFVSKGCGFKINYMKLKATPGKDSKSIKRITLNPDQISVDNTINLTDETPAHLFIYF